MESVVSEESWFDKNSTLISVELSKKQLNFVSFIFFRKYNCFKMNTWYLSCMGFYYIFIKFVVLKQCF